MRLVSVECKNFRQYKDLKITFPKIGSFDIHIIEASNGVGKTNLLNAINWCLYGDEPHRSGMLQRDVAQRYTDNADRLPLYNIVAMRELEQDAKSTCNVMVSVQLEIVGEVYTFRRTQQFKVPSGVPFGKNSISCSKISSSGATVFLEDTEIGTKIASVLPIDIREYFYFDGEQLLTYFNDNKRQNVKEKVYAIAQINILDEVKEHLRKIIAQYKSEFAKNDPKLDVKERAANEAKVLYENKKQHLEQVNAEIAEAERVIAEINDALNGRIYISAINNECETSKKLRDSYVVELEGLRKKLDKFLWQNLIKVFLYSNNKNVVEYISQRQKEDASFTDVRESDLQQSIDFCECKLCGETLSKAKVQFMKALLVKIKGNASAKKITDIMPYAQKALLVEGFNEAKNDLLSNIQRKEKELQDIEAKIADLTNKIREFGANAVEDVARKIKQKEAYENSLAKKRTEQVKYSVQKEELYRDYLKKQAEYDDALKNAAEHENTKKYWEFAQKSYSVLECVISDMTGTARMNIANRTEELFKELIWKKDVYGKVELSEDYGLKLYHEYNNKSCLDSCSASETELLALAFTLAVHEISGYDSFLLIDTPVGRVSDSNRKNFAKVLLDISTKKQIILEVTPSEYSEEIKDVLNSKVLSGYVKLSLNDNNVEKEN